MLRRTALAAIAALPSLLFGRPKPQAMTAPELTKSGLDFNGTTDGLVCAWHPNGYVYDIRFQKSSSLDNIRLPPEFTL